MAGLDTNAMVWFTGGMTTPVQNDDLNEDWIKTLRWDLGFDTLNGLFGFLGVSSAPVRQQRDALHEFTALPAWQAAPDQLRQQAAAWLRSGATTAAD